MNILAINAEEKVPLNYEYARHKKNEATLPLSGGPLVLFLARQSFSFSVSCVLGKNQRLTGQIEHALHTVYKHHQAPLHGNSDKFCDLE